MDTDDNFWKVYDFTFIDGKPYDRSAFEAGLAEAVISESIARRVFGSANVAGKELLINYVPYKVVGVVKDVSTLGHRRLRYRVGPVHIDQYSQRRLERRHHGVCLPLPYLPATERISLI